MKKLSLVLLFFSIINFVFAEIKINEIMQSNIDCIMDDINEFPDSWVELANSDEVAVNLKDYKIGLTDDASKAWQLPDRTLSSHSYVLIYCDKEGKSLHTDFRLESGKGGAVYLFKGDVVIDKLENLKKQPAPNVSYGRETETSTKWGYQAKPTPSSPNCGQLVSTVLGAPVFSTKGKVFSSGSINLIITLPDGAPEGTKIVYTTDGTEPTASSTEYSSSISITDTKIIRAKLVCDGYISPRSTVHSYIKFPRQVTLPVISIVTKDSYFYDNKIGIYVAGTYDTSTTDENSRTKNYQYDWRRPINFELFEGEGREAVLNQLCETRAHGGASRGAKLKSLAVYANKRFGEKRFNYELFPDQKPGLTDFKSFIIRNAGNDFDYLYMRDAVMQRIMAENTDLDWQAWKPAVFYFNGEYKGMLNFRERTNEDNIYTNYNGLEDIDMIENWGELKSGTRNSFDEFTAFYKETGHTWEEYDERLDLNEYLNYVIMNLFFCNLDWPGNNCVMWRPSAEGGKWRFIAKDTDFGLGLYDRSSSYNTLEWLHNQSYDSNNAWANGSDHTRLFRRLEAVPEFKREFIDRCAIYMGDFMNYERTWEIWEPMYNLIKTEYPNHRKLINQWWPSYSNELTKAQNWLKERTGNFYTILSNYYSIGAPTPLYINKELATSDLEQIGVDFNGVRLTRNKFDGKFFVGRNITLTSENVKSWTVKTTSTSGVVTTEEISGGTYTFAMPTCQKLEITAVLGTPDGIDTVKLEDADSAIQEVYDLNGRRLERPKKGVNIIKYLNGKVGRVVY